MYDDSIRLVPADFGLEIVDMARKVTRRDLSDAVTDYLAGETLADICQRHHVDVRTLKRDLIERGISWRARNYRKPKPRPDWYTTVRTRYVAGESLTRLSKEHHIAQQTLRKWLEAEGIVVRDFKEGAKAAIDLLPPEWHEERRQKMREAGALRRIDIPLDELASRYQAGETELALARAYGVARTAIRHRLESIGIPLRSQAETNRMLLARVSPEERKRRLDASHAALRGRKQAPEHRETIARSRQERQTHVSESERQLHGWLSERGLVGIPQQAVGPYNVDIGAYPVAVEVFGGTWHFSRDHAERFNYLFNAGWHVVIVFVDKRRSTLTPEAADYIVAFHEQAAGDPTARREYRVIWGEGKLFATGGPDGHELAAIVPRRGRYRGRTTN